MKILVNGDALEIPAAATIADLVKQLDLEGRRIAVEVNEELVPRSTYVAHPIQDGDHIEIVQAIGGG